MPKIAMERFDAKNLKQKNIYLINLKNDNDNITEWH